jgi:hypothetical protein
MVSSFKEAFILTLSESARTNLVSRSTPATEALAFCEFSKPIDPALRASLLDKLQLVGLVMHANAALERARNRPPNAEALSEEDLIRHKAALEGLEKAAEVCLHGIGVKLDWDRFRRWKREDVAAITEQVWDELRLATWFGWFHGREEELKLPLC